MPSAHISHLHLAAFPALVTEPAGAAGPCKSHAVLGVTAAHPHPIRLGQLLLLHLPSSAALGQGTALGQRDSTGTALGHSGAALGQPWDSTSHSALWDTGRLRPAQDWLHWILPALHSSLGPHRKWILCKPHSILHPQAIMSMASLPRQASPALISGN